MFLHRLQVPSANMGPPRTGVRTSGGGNRNATDQKTQHVNMTQPYYEAHVKQRKWNWGALFPKAMYQNVDEWRVQNCEGKESRRKDASSPPR